ncbi:MAG: prepilin-type N-terminal cleavage/methylation domain-containing protein [Acidobacteria bacterium]|nr:prepilin-type N-terminal cleavage/methylation domain-containing protein [Acidobacteriota bacterium]
MERSTVIGNPLSFVLCPLFFVRSRQQAQDVARAQSTKRKAQSTNAGFTLLELMIVMFIMVILVAVALPQYQRSVVHARESVLRDDLFKMRTLIDQYAADKGKLPQSLDDLVSANYMREIPVDPMTDERTWNVIIGEDPNSREGEQGVVDVHSLSTDTSTEGTPYNEW